MSVYVFYQFGGVITTIESNTNYTINHEKLDTSTRATSKHSESADAIVHASLNAPKTSYTIVLRYKSLAMSMLCGYYTSWCCYTNYMRVVDHDIDVNVSQG
jgi:hypothetical protein